MLLSLPGERLALVLPRQENHHAGDCRIIRGPNASYFENLVGKSVAPVRRSVARVFGIPADAELGSAAPWSMAGTGFVRAIRCSFCGVWGQKGAFTKFGTILADPAWPYRSPRAVVGNGGRGNQDGRAKDIIQVDVGAHYPVMTLEEIKRLPVKDIAADAAHLYLWTTNAFMVEAHEVARAWGFEPKTILTWVKVKHDGRKCR